MVTEQQELKVSVMEVFTYGNPEASAVLLQMVDDHDLLAIENEVSEIPKRTSADFLLLAVKVSNWNHDLSPWKAPAVFGAEDFGGGAEETLHEILKLTHDGRKAYYIGGYSLAGLFALWAAYRTDVFQGAAAASPSVWFPGFTDWMKQRNIQIDSAYLSLGDKEARTRNPVMCTVEDRLREVYAILNTQGISCTLEWNPGNHFRDADIRTAKAFAWILNQ